MKLRWIGITGAALVLAALVLGSLGPSLWPSAFWNSSYNRPMGPGMMGGGMMGPGMMGGSMMGGGMMTNRLAATNAPFDQRFLDQMSMHHQAAVMSAQMMIANSARPELRDLAQRIIAGQQREIDQMQQWRQDWYGGAGTMPGMSGGGMMSGMMNDNPMRQMMGQSGDLDRMFLQMMIPHHQAAIAMARQALAQAEHAEIKTLAQSIITTQQAEIAEMQGYLKQ